MTRETAGLTMRWGAVAALVLALVGSVIGFNFQGDLAIADRTRTIELQKPDRVECQRRVQKAEDRIGKHVTELKEDMRLADNKIDEKLERILEKIERISH